MRPTGTAPAAKAGDQWGEAANRIAISTERAPSGVAGPLDRRTTQGIGRGGTRGRGEPRATSRLVAIHPFPNGKGRCSRLAADLLAQKLGQPRFTWGSANPVAIADTRRAYVAALQAADRGDTGPLLAFARS